MLLGVEDPTPGRLFGCDSFVDLAQPWLALGTFAVTKPAWTLPFAVPNLASLRGVTVASQAWFVTSSGVQATNGVALTLGNR